MKFEELDLAPELLSALTACGYAEPTPIQAQAIPHLNRGPRSHRLRADRHRQDRRVRAACAAAPRAVGQPRKARAQRCRLALRSRAGADARAGATGRRGSRALRQEPPREHGVHLRRRTLSGAEPRALARRRHHRRDSRPPHRSSGARAHRLVDAGRAGAGRSRPDARHGLRRRRRAHRGARSQDAPDGAVLGDLRRRHRPAVRAPAARRRAHRHRIRSRARRARSSSACILPTTIRTSTGSSITCWPTSPSRRASSSSRPSATPSRWRSGSRAKAMPPRRCTAT